MSYLDDPCPPSGPPPGTLDRVLAEAARRRWRRRARDRGRSMNRAERRRAAREKRPVMIVGDGIVATELGQRYETRPAAGLAPKVPRVHRWIATGAWVLSDDAARGAHDADLPKILDRENLMYLVIGCWDCERALGEIAADSVCSAARDD